MKTDSEILREIANEILKLSLTNETLTFKSMQVNAAYISNLISISDQLESEQPKKMRTMLQDAINESDQLQQQDVSEELEDAYKEGIREGYNERHKYD